MLDTVKEKKTLNRQKALKNNIQRRKLAQNYKDFSDHSTDTSSHLRKDHQ